MQATLNSSVFIFGQPFVQELIRRWDSERELLLRRYLTRTSKCNPLLNIQHDAGGRQWRREWAWPRGITARRFNHAPICSDEVSLSEFILPEYDLATGEFLILTHSLGVIQCEYRFKSLKTRSFELHLCRRKFRYIFNHFYARRSSSNKIKI